MRVLAIPVFVLLVAIASLHAYWGLGGLWPSTDVRSLIDAVVGDPRMDEMPPAWMTFAVAGLLLASGMFAMLATTAVREMLRFLVKAAIAANAFIFVARGASGYLLPESIRSQLSEPFASYDQLYYSPLCLAIGAAFCVLFFARSPNRIEGTRR